MFIFVNLTYILYVLPVENNNLKESYKTSHCLYSETFLLNKTKYHQLDNSLHFFYFLAFKNNIL